MSLIRQVLENMDMEFIAHASKCSSFNIPSKYFESKEKKDEIRHLIQVNWFNGSDIQFYPKFNERNLKAGVKQLRDLDYKAFEKLFFYDKKGLGPGEVLTYFLFDDVSVGGGQSAGVDIIASTGLYEMKAVIPTMKAGEIWGKGIFVTNFKLGGTVGLDKLVTELKDMKKEAAKIDPKYGKAKEVGLTHYDFFAKQFPKRWKNVVKEFQKIAYSYFENEKLVCLAGKSTAGYTLGDVILFGDVKKENILLGNQTSGTIKPIIRVK